MYILHGGDFTRSVLVQWVLEEGGLEYEFRRIDIFKGEHRASEFLAINPAGLVPVLITPEGQALYETAALMLYLADRHGLTGLAPPVTDPSRGLFLSTIFYLASDIQSEMKRFHYPHRFSPEVSLCPTRLICAFPVRRQSAAASPIVCLACGSRSALSKSKNT
jgi:glutathione S-transferase